MMKHIANCIFVYIPAIFAAISLILVFAMRSGEIPFTPRMLMTGDDREYHWVKIDDVSDEMIRAIIAAEDMSFFKHNGFDRMQLAIMEQENSLFGKPIRGCSTISQQTAKNCFTFGSRTWARKAVEAYFTVLIEKIWGKQRILEVYLNVAQTGEKIFGVEAAAHHYYGTAASRLTMSEATAIACCLPNPNYRTPDWVECNMFGKRAIIAKRACNINNLNQYLQ